MIDVVEARALILQNCGYAKPVFLPLAEANGCILSETVVSPVDTPPFSQSAMDGYAFAFSDWDGSTELRIAGELQAGSRYAEALEPGTAMRIFTGAPLPPRADTVVMQEKVQAADEKIRVLDDKLVLGRNVRPQGSQTKKGEAAMEAGQLITPAGISFLASLGIGKVRVFSKPSVGIIVTGRELILPGELAADGKIFESNSAGLLAALAQLNISGAEAEIADDDANAIKTAVSKHLKKDLLILTGGISVGEYDLVAPALESCGVKKIFHRVKQKPGKPFYFGIANSTLVFALPGNPAAVLTCFYEYIVPVISRFTKKEYFHKMVMPLAADYKKSPGLTYFLKGKINDGAVHILEGQESYKMNSFALADCLIELEPEKEFCEKGSPVNILMIL